MAVMKQKAAAVLLEGEVQLQQTKRLKHKASTASSRQASPPPK
jgi:hypothetical protein